MRPFAYARPATVSEAVSLLGAAGVGARVIAGGTDLIIRLRDGSIRPPLVVDVKRIGDIDPAIRERDGQLVFGATTVMTDIAEDARVRAWFPALAEAAAVVGSVQIRNRATLAGNLCNASPAADTAPSLLVYGARVVASGPAGTRRIPVDELFVRSGVTTLEPGELVTAVEIPRPAWRAGSVHLRRTRRRGHDLASVTLACAVDERGAVRLAYGSVGPRPVLVTDDAGTLADPATPPEAVAALLERLLSAASPSARSMRAGPEYRLAMLRLLATRGLRIATDRLAREAA